MFLEGLEICPLPPPPNTQMLSIVFVGDYVAQDRRVGVAVVGSVAVLVLLCCS